METNIFCIGDSFVNLTSPSVTTWPEYLSNICPSDTIVNLGYPGAGTDLSIATLVHSIAGVKIKDSNKVIKPDVVIFQVSDPFRELYVTDRFPSNHVSEHIRYKSDNYIIWSHEPYKTADYFRDHATPFNIGLLKFKSFIRNFRSHAKHFKHKLQYEFSRQHYNQHIFVRRDMVYIRHLCKQANIPLILYTHKNSGVEIYTDFSIESLLGTKKFMEYVFDNGYHFGNEGNKFVASLMKEKI